MVSKTISKNGVSVKSLNSKGSSLRKKVLSVIVLIIISLSVSVMHSCTNSGEKTSNSGDDSSSLLVGIWLREEGQTKIPGDRLELLKDGESISGGYSFSWKAENGIIHLTAPLGIAWSYNYNISGSKLTLSGNDGSEATYIKKQM